MKRWILILLLVFGLISIASFFLPKDSKMNLFRMLFQKTERLSDEELKQMIQNGATLIDVRSPAEFEEGHIPDSRNYPLPQLRQHIEELKAENSPVIAVCRSGRRSGMATKILHADSIQAYNGGGWKDFQKILNNE